MSKERSRNMGRKRSQGNTTPQEPSNNNNRGCGRSEEDESPFADLRRMMLRMLNELEEEHAKTTQ
jgi:hypothetical protein